VGLIRFAFPDSNGADSRFMGNHEPDLEERPSAWPLCDERLSAEKIISSETKVNAQRPSFDASVQMMAANVHQGIA
jgi:hypothetical protein